MDSSTRFPNESKFYIKLSVTSGILGLLHRGSTQTTDTRRGTAPVSKKEMTTVEEINVNTFCLDDA